MSEPTKDRKPEVIPAFRVPRAAADKIRQIAADNRRKINEVAELLVERGLAAFERDGHLLESEARKAAEQKARAQFAQRYNELTSQ